MPSPLLPKDIQHILNIVAGTSLVADGSIGPKTQAAIDAFRAANNCSVVTAAGGDQLDSVLKRAFLRKLDAQWMAKIGLSGSVAARFGPVLATALEQADIATPLRVAAFMANAIHESGGFTTLVENLNYSATALANTWPNRYRDEGGQPSALAKSIERNQEAIANNTYCNRNGNGDVYSGDGYRYRGRGCFQLTFKNNYAKCGEALNIDLVAQPDLVATNPTVALGSACWYWNNAGLSKYADAMLFDSVCDMINIGHLTDKAGDSIGWRERKKHYDSILTSFGIVSR